MTNFTHLTQNQIFAYASGSLSEPESNEIGRHLIQCAVCRQSLPAPSVEQFRAAIMTEREIEGNSNVEEFDYSLPSILSFVPRFFTQPGSLLLGGGALIVLLSFSALIRFGAGDSEREISHSFVRNDSKIISNQDSPIAAPTAKNDQRFSYSDTNSNGTFSTPKVIGTVSPKRNSPSTAPKNSKEFSERKLPADKSIAATRGVPPKCEDGQSFESRAVMDGEKIVLKWEKIPNAAKYDLYVSDENEILVDEFETTEATSYVLEKKLDAGKVYKWKIIVTLENGKTVVGDSQKLTVKNLQSIQRKPGNRSKSAVRCSVNSLIEN